MFSLDLDRDSSISRRILDLVYYAYPLVAVQVAVPIAVYL